MAETSIFALPLSARASIDTRKARAPSLVHRIVTVPGVPVWLQDRLRLAENGSSLRGFDRCAEQDRSVSRCGDYEFQFVAAGRDGVDYDTAPGASSAGRKSMARPPPSEIGPGGPGSTCRETKTADAAPRTRPLPGRRCQERIAAHVARRSRRPFGRAPVLSRCRPASGSRPRCATCR